MALKSIKDDDFDPAVDEEISESPADQSKTGTLGNSLEERLVAAMEMMSRSNALLAERADEGPIKQIPLPKAKLRTPWNPSGRRLGRPKLTRSTYMNGNMLREITLSDEEIEGLNQIHAGRYLNGKCVVQEKFADQGKDEIEIRIANKTMDDKIQMAQYAPSIAILCMKILEEAAAREQ